MKGERKKELDIKFKLRTLGGLGTIKADITFKETRTAGGVTKTMTDRDVVIESEPLNILDAEKAYEGLASRILEILGRIGALD